MKKIYSILAILCAIVIAVSCSNDSESLESVGFIKLEMNTLVSTHTRTAVPSGYAPKTLHVTITNGITTLEGDYTEANGFTNSDMSGNIMLTPGEYTITAHSANWDGSEAALNAPYYSGESAVTVESKKLKKVTVTCTQSNVKMTVNWDESFRTYFDDAECRVTSAASPSTPIVFSMPESATETNDPGYFPVGKLTLKVSVVNKAGGEFVQTNTIEEVAARDHFIITYKVADAGKQGDVQVFIDDATNTYTYIVSVPVAPTINLTANAANAWSNFAYLSGSVSVAEYDAAKMKVQWKQNGAADWTEIAGTDLPLDNSDAFSYKLTGLTPQTTYVYRIVYNDDGEETVSNEASFTTEAQTAIYNGGFENWYADDGIAICGNAADGKYWNSSNAGAADYIGNVTTQDTDFKHGGSSSAKLATAWAVVKLAAASLFTGDFVGLIGTKGAKLDWGVPFTSRPTALKGYLSYAPGSINRGSQPSGVGAPASGSNDECQIFCALVTELFHVANATAAGYQMTTEIDWQNDSRVVAYGQVTRNTSSNGQWEELNIPLEYHSLTTKPTHMIIVCSASKYGDYFYGSTESVLHIDDFELIYGDNPVTQ